MPFSKVRGFDTIFERRLQVQLDSYLGCMVMSFAWLLLQEIIFYKIIFLLSFYGFKDRKKTDSVLFSGHLFTKTKISFPATDFLKFAVCPVKSKDGRG